MNETIKGIEALKKEIRSEVRAIFKLNMMFEGWSVSEMDDAKAKEKILAVTPSLISHVLEILKMQKIEWNISRKYHDEPII